MNMHQLKAHLAKPRMDAADLVLDGDLLLYGDVGDMWGDGTGFSSSNVLKALSSMSGPLNVRINSGGGLVDEGIAIYNALASYDKGPVSVCVDGIAASAASLIAMAGKTRKMGVGAMMMIHDPAGVTWGTAADHAKTADVLDKMGSSFASIYAQASGKKPDEMRQMMLDETWFTADEAVMCGLATEVTAPPAEQKDGAAGLVDAAMFDYMQYRNAPATLKTAQRKLPDAITAAHAAQQTSVTMTKEEIAAQAAAVKLVADATAEATSITAAAKAGTAEVQAKAKGDADKIILDATNAAKALTDAANVATANVTKDILDRCTTAKLTLAQAVDIVAKANGSLDTAKDLVIAAILARATDQRHTPAVVVADERDRFKAGATKGLLYRAFSTHKDAERNEFTGMTLRELARAHLTMHGNTLSFRDPLEMAGAAFKPVMAVGEHSTSDFAEILANVANKSMLKGWDETPETFQLWTAVGTLVDFKPAKRVDLNVAPSLDLVAEGAEYNFGTIGDRGETIVLASYGKMFAITRQAIVNDDLGAFTRIPQKMGRAARRSIGNLVYASLTSNLDMSDSIPLFDASHHNYVEGSTFGHVPSVITVTAAIAAMRLQKDPDGNASGGLNIVPSYLLTPVELEGLSNALMQAVNDPAATTPNVPNTVKGVAQVIADARLSANSATAWYMAANPNIYDTIEVAYLNGNQQPVLEQRDGWYVDGVEFKVRIDAGVKPLDFRGLYKNKGTT